jgi:hypothetical protein
MECGFINTDDDRKVLDNEIGLYNIAKGVARGVVSYLGIKWVAPTSQVDTQTQELVELSTRLAESEAKCLIYLEKLKQISSISIL